MISLDEYINENNDKIEAVINIYENQPIRYTEKIFSEGIIPIGYLRRLI